jgi:hypothetical protein
MVEAAAVMFLKRIKKYNVTRGWGKLLSEEVYTT